jgi:hypothetical protein
VATGSGKPEAPRLHLQAIIFAVIVLPILLTSCYTKEEREAIALKARQKKASTRDYSMTPPPPYNFSEIKPQQEPEPPPSTDPASDAKWTAHTIQLPEGMRMQDACVSGREACILAYGSEGAIFVGTIDRALKLKPVVKSAQSPDGYVAVNAVIAGGKTFVFFDPGRYRPDKMPDIHQFGLGNSNRPPPTGSDEGLLPQVCWWNAGAKKWTVVENLPDGLQRIYGNGGRDVILFCDDYSRSRRDFYAYRPGGEARSLYSETKAVFGITNAKKDEFPSGVYSFYGDEALCTVNLDGEYVKRQRHTYRWLGIIKPDGDWGLNVRLTDLWSPIVREAGVLDLPQRKYVFIDGGLCEYSESLNLIRRFRLPDAMRALAVQQQAKALPMDGGLFVYEPRSRRVTILLNPELEG